MWRCLADAEHGMLKASSDGNFSRMPLMLGCANYHILGLITSSLAEISSCRLDIFSSGAERCLPLLARSQRSKFIPHLLSHCARLNVQVYRPFTPGTGVRCPTFGSTCPGIAACAPSCFGSSDALFPVIRLSSTGDTVSLHLLLTRFLR